MRLCLPTILALLAPLSAWAQEDPEELPPITFGTAEEPVEEGPPPEAEAKSFQGYRWEATAPATLRDVSDIAVHPDDSTLIALVTAAGSAWLSEDGGLRWREVLVSGDALGSLSDDEALIRDVEAFIEDVVDQVSADDPTEYEDFADAESEADAIAAALQDAADQATAAADTVRGDVDTGAALLDRSDADGGGAKVWWGPNGELFVGRADGLHYSTDNGGRFSQVLDVQVRALSYLPTRGLWVAGTDDGVRWAIDPRGWIDAEDATDGVVVRDLSSGPLGMYAATDHGVFFAEDAQDWQRLGEPASYLAIEADPDWSGGFWVSSEDRIWRSDDQGQSLRASLGAPLRQVVDIERVTRGQLLVATRTDGPWESMDGGTRFSPLAAGLQEADTRGIALRGRAVYVASVEGALRLVETAPEAVETVAYVPLGALLDASIVREGLAPRGPTAASLLRKVLPSLVVEGYRHATDDLMWNGGTSAGDGSEWRVSTRLVFSPRPGRRVGGDVDLDSTTTVLVVDGSVELVTDNEGLTGSMDRRGRRGAISYRSTLIERISAVYGARAELAGRPRGELTLAEAVELELRLQELDAELDLLTDGMVSSWMLTAREEG
ncbi:MAG: hypothetical protein EP330_20965 [Deltaproteobacteria bacterium]|nr:MAG: hypothetical protein EP330_20965 [Deltaproteobacteria bacterium]